MFGEWGALILQLTITVVVVLGLIAVVYWLVRRYSSGGLGRIGRGRVPRLAVIDAMAVDGRRRLVLVRRDNVEHLILIGGPTDVVVEQAIQRPRQRVAARPPATPGTGEAPPEPATVVVDNPPIPFPQSRIHQPAAVQTPAYRAEAYQPPAPQPAYQPASPPAAYQPVPQPIERPFSPVRRSAQPVRAEPMPAPPAATVVQFEPMEETAPLFPELPPATPAYDEPTASASRQMGDGNGQSPLDFGGMRAANPFAAPSPEAADDTAAKVNDLEREMARLLGEITQKRPS